MAIDINQIGYRLEDVETDADRKRDVWRGDGNADALQLVGDEVGIFEHP